MQCYFYLPALSATCTVVSGSIAHGSHCYKFVDSKVTWTAARASCISEGTGWELASIHSDDENNFVWAQKPEEVWIGLHQPSNGQSSGTPFAWSDGTDANDGYQSSWPWKSGQPNNKNHNGVYVSNYYPLSVCICPDNVVSNGYAPNNY